MDYLFMDEKGPQNTFKIQKPFDKINKLSYANDNMHSYVANVISINKSYYMQIEQNYKNIVDDFLSCRPQLKKALKTKKRELKGLDVLKSNFEYGIASMKKNELKFYTNLIDLLLNYNVENLFFVISKMSIITSSRLVNFFYFIDSNTSFSPFLVKYVITKYCEVEASEEVIKALLNKKISTIKILRLIRNDMNNIIMKNKNNKRMSLQTQCYRQIIMLIDMTLNCKTKLIEPQLSLSFDWNKVRWAFDLWLTEKDNKKHPTKKKLFLDEGIPHDIFSDLNIDTVISNCNSKDYIGLQITDMLVVLIGKLISQLTSATKYNFAKPDQPVLLHEAYFNLSKEKFDFIKKLHKFILNKKNNYHFINDSYFDESVLFQSYIEYIVKYRDFEDYSKTDITKHSFLHMQLFIKLTDLKYKEGLTNELTTKKLFGSIQTAIEKKICRPL